MLIEIKDDLDPLLKAIKENKVNNIQYKQEIRRIAKENKIPQWVIEFHICFELGLISKV